MASVGNFAYRGGRRRAQARGNGGAIRRASKDRLVVVQSAAELRATVLPTLLDFTNVEQFDAIADAGVLLYYTETDDDVLFDADNDAALLELHKRPYSFNNALSLGNYEALTERARYYCKPHPNQALARQQAAVELGHDDADLLIMVYKRDSPSESLVKQRQRTPFRNAVNGLGRDAPLVLFRQFSHDPFASVTLVWHREAHINASIGLVGFSVGELYG